MSAEHWKDFRLLRPTAGWIVQIRSDNGTNFVGANKELSNALKEMDNDVIQDKLSKIGIDWIFNPPSSSHMGGIWERQIRTIRQVLTGILHEHSEKSLGVLVSKSQSEI